MEAYLKICKVDCPYLDLKRKLTDTVFEVGFDTISINAKGFTFGSDIRFTDVGKILNKVGFIENAR